jgi:hypothetical protein
MYWVAYRVQSRRVHEGEPSARSLGSPHNAAMVKTTLPTLWRMLVESEYGIVVLLFLSVSLAGAFLIFMRRHVFMRRTLTTPWCFHGFGTVQMLAICIFLPKPLNLVGFVSAGLCLANTVAMFLAARQQFTERTLLLLTFGVVLLCSLCCYVPIKILAASAVIPAGLGAF